MLLERLLFLPSHILFNTKCIHEYYKEKLKIEKPQKGSNTKGNQAFNSDIRGFLSVDFRSEGHGISDLVHKENLKFSSAQCQLKIL